MKFLLSLSIVFLSFGFGHQAHAQSNPKDGGFSAGSSVRFESEKSLLEKKNKELFDLNLPENAEVTVVEDKYADEYILSSVPNLSKLYWKKSAIDINDDKAVDNYLLINECDIYQQFYADDFEWLRIRKAARELLMQSKDSFPDKFKMMVPVDLGRYDLEKKGFHLINDTAFLDLRRIEIGGNRANEKICGVDADIKHYPRNMILILSKPFSFDFVKLDEHVAQAYIIQQRYDPPKIPHQLKDKKYNRLAFARIRMSFKAYQGETRGGDGYSRAIMFGNLDGIDIFEDIDETRLLTSVDFKN